MGGRSISRQVGRLKATIANGTSLSSIIQLGGEVIASIEMSAVWTAAALTFQGSSDGVTFGDVYGDDGVEVTIASVNVVAGRFIVNKAILEQLAGCTHLKIRSGTSGLPVNQAAERVLTIVTKG